MQLATVCRVPLHRKQGNRGQSFLICPGSEHFFALFNFFAGGLGTARLGCATSRNTATVGGGWGSLGQENASLGAASLGCGQVAASRSRNSDAMGRAWGSQGQEDTTVGAASRNAGCGRQLVVGGRRRERGNAATRAISKSAGCGQHLAGRGRSERRNATLGVGPRHRLVRS